METIWKCAVLVHLSTAKPALDPCIHLKSVSTMYTSTTHFSYSATDGEVHKGVPLYFKWP